MSRQDLGYAEWLNEQDQTEEDRGRAGEAAIADMVAMGGVLKDNEARQKAEEHWAWLETVLHKIAVDFFIHGWKHGEARKAPQVFGDL